MDVILKWELGRRVGWCMEQIVMIILWIMHYTLRENHISFDVILWVLLRREWAFNPVNINVTEGSLFWLAMSLAQSNHTALINPFNTRLTHELNIVLFYQKWQSEQGYKKPLCTILYYSICKQKRTDRNLGGTPNSVIPSANYLETLHLKEMEQWIHTAPMHILISSVQLCWHRNK